MPRPLTSGLGIWGFGGYRISGNYLLLAFMISNMVLVIAAVIVIIVVIIIIIVIIDITITIITKLSSTSSSPSPLQGFSYGIPLYLKAIQGSALGLGWCNICRQRTEPWARRVSRHYVYSCHFLFQELKLLNLRLLIVTIVFNTAVIFGFVVVISRISITSISMASMGLFLFCWYDFSRPLQ